MTGGGGGGGVGPTEVHILYPKKSQLLNLYTSKNPTPAVNALMLLLI